MDRIEATYYVETPYPLADAAAVMAGEQSSGTFVAIPGETEELKMQYAARVEQIEELETVAASSLSGEQLHFEKYHRGKVTISWSLANFGVNLPVLCSTLMGNLYELRQFTGIKLIDIQLPDSYTAHFRGPKFGIRGTAELISLEAKTPLVGTIIKPSVGLTIEDTADLVRRLAEAGIDFIKDDELMGSAHNSPFGKRVNAIMEVLNRYQDKTGKKVMYAFNISDEMDNMLRHYEHVVKAGGSCAMISLYSVGLTAVKRIADIGQLTIHGHRNGWGMLNRHPLLGVTFAAYQKLWRLAGVDQLHVNGIRNKFWESDESVVKSIKACLTPMEGVLPALPVLSSGQWGGQAIDTYKLTQATDYLYLAGGGIMAHPGGISGGVNGIKQAWEAAVRGLTLEEATQKYPAVKQAVEKFGGVKA
ncbi:ribulose-bisphosphate carboxylase large subunit family protein [Sphingobacterium sp. DN00404]|uniref:Ribulose-bisphosphate carboxylase large subunit family protein n=1 Tax=Sphingobacterium micropteri TaxID=2763501 RepID=A0ABR7YUY5_9SPHI|nr:ribulose-bisphosphate carboxylase large subunit family protein [Sphingobacterium micropteri]MBD1434986.1 ribulose-bisphosphate carboxylase large subunit family protein [Sphingobacterium micropteri]